MVIQSISTEVIPSEVSQWPHKCTCDRLECGEEYTGESARTFVERLKEHLMALSPTYVHVNTTGHLTSLDNFSMVGKKSHNLTKTIKEAMYIRVNGSSLNKNIGKYQLSHIQDEVLFNTQYLQFKQTLLHTRGPLHLAHTKVGQGGVGGSYIV